MKHLYWLALAAAALLCAQAPALAGPIPGFPAIGSAAGPDPLITVNLDGSISITGTGNGPFDGIEDTYVGVVNNSTGFVLKSLHLTGGNIFGFDGDGTVLPYLNDYVGTGVGATNGVPITFAINNANDGTVIFNGKVGLLPGERAYFGLEEAPGAISGATGNITTVPEPASLALVGMSAVALAGWSWRKRKQTAA